MTLSVSVGLEEQREILTPRPTSLSLPQCRQAQAQMGLMKQPSARRAVLPVVFFGAPEP